jgi:hypothetical protein
MRGEELATVMPKLPADNDEEKEHGECGWPGR